MFGCLSCAAARASRKKSSDSAPAQLALARNLDRHGAVEVGVAGLPNRAEATHADAAHQVKSADLLQRAARGMIFLPVDEAEITAAATAIDLVERGVGKQFQRHLAMWTTNVQSP